MTRYLTRTSIVLTAALGLGLIAPSQSAAQQRCSAFTASGMSSAAELCGCEVVTQGFLRSVTRKDNFPGLLTTVQQQCPKLGVLLTDLPTAAPAPAISNPPSGRGPVTTVSEPDPEEEPEQEPEKCYDDYYDQV